MFISLFFLISSLRANEVVTTLPEFSWVVKSINKDIKVTSLLEGSEDPHFVDASPAFIFKVAKAKVMIHNGLELEVGWLPKVIEQSGNKNIQFNEKGNCNSSQHVEVVGAINNYNRSMGDVHPQGNPHYTLSPKQMIKAAKTIGSCLKNNGFDTKGLALLVNKLELLDRKLQLNKKVYVYHREFQYLQKDYALKILRSIEKTPGVLPSATHLFQVATHAKQEKPAYVLAATTSSERILEKFQEISSIKSKIVAVHPRSDQDYIEFIKDLFQTLNND